MSIVAFGPPSSEPTRPYVRWTEEEDDVFFDAIARSTSDTFNPDIVKLPNKSPTEIRSRYYRAILGVDKYLRKASIMRLIRPNDGRDERIVLTAWREAIRESWREIERDPEQAAQAVRLRRPLDGRTGLGIQEIIIRFYRRVFTKNLRRLIREGRGEPEPAPVPEPVSADPAPAPALASSPDPLPLVQMVPDPTKKRPPSRSPQPPPRRAPPRGRIVPPPPPPPQEVDLAASLPPSDSTLFKHLGGGGGGSMPWWLQPPSSLGPETDPKRMTAADRRDFDELMADMRRPSDEPKLWL